MSAFCLSEVRGECSAFLGMQHRDQQQACAWTLTETSLSFSVLFFVLIKKKSPMALAHLNPVVMNWDVRYRNL